MGGEDTIIRLNTDVFTAEELGALRQASRRMGASFDLYQLAAASNRPVVEVNRALDALIGREPGEAARWLNAHPREGGGGLTAKARPQPAVRRFLAGMFGR